MDIEILRDGVPQLPHPRRYGFIRRDEVSAVLSHDPVQQGAADGLRGARARSFLLGGAGAVHSALIDGSQVEISLGNFAVQ